VLWLRLALPVEARLMNCGILTWLDWTRGTGETGPHFPSCSRVHLWIGRESHSVHVAPSGIGRSRGAYRGLKVGISHEDKRTQETQTSRVEATQRQGGGWLDIFFNALFQLFP